MWKRRLEDFKNKYSEDQILDLLTNNDLLFNRELTLEDILDLTEEQAQALYCWSFNRHSDDTHRYNSYILIDKLNIPHDYNYDTWRTLCIEFDELSEEEQKNIQGSIDSSLYLSSCKLSFDDVSRLTLNQKVCLFRYWSDIYMEEDNLTSEHNYFVLRCELDNS